MSKSDDEQSLKELYITRQKQVIVVENSINQLMQDVNKLIQTDNNVVMLKDKIIEDLRQKDKKK